MFRRALRPIVTVVLPAIVAAVIWGGLALWFDGPSSRVVAGTMSVAMGFTSLLLAKPVRPLWRGLRCDLACSPASMGEGLPETRGVEQTE
jgi:hypothetical protein